MKVETHNHPTAISPFPGAATGSGGEIRDEGATGRGAKPKAGLTGFSVSHLRIPGLRAAVGKGAACAAGQARSHRLGARHHDRRPDRRRRVQQRIRPAEHLRLFPHVRAGGARAMPANRVRGYHKPIMIAGGLGNVRRKHVEKCEIPVGAKIVVLGGPAMLIGLGGGAASSMGSGASSADLDFASVQRGNPEIQRRAQEVIDRCSRALDAQSDPARSTTSAPAVCRTPCPKPWRTRRAAARVIDWRRFRTTSPACRRWNCGATSRRSATCCCIDAAQARRFRGDLRAASAARSPCSARSTTPACWCSKTSRTARARSICRSKCC